MGDVVTDSVSESMNNFSIKNSIAEQDMTRKQAPNRKVHSRQATQKDIISPRRLWDGPTLNKCKLPSGADSHEIGAEFRDKGIATLQAHGERQTPWDNTSQNCGVGRGDLGHLLAEF